jgi:hypothetical protein
MLQAEWKDLRTRRQMNPDVRVGLGSASFWSATDYLQAQRIRRRITAHFSRAFKVCVALAARMPRSHTWRMRHSF